MDKHNVNIPQVFDIPEHGKGEVDHVGVKAKSTISCEIAGGTFFTGVNEMVLMLDKFSIENIPPKDDKLLSTIIK